MKVKLPPFAAGYGPVGHPLAAVHKVSTDDDFASEYGRWLHRQQAQGVIPLVYVKDSSSMASQGFHILDVVNGEIDDAVIAALPVPRQYAPAKPGEPGRQMAEWRHVLPSFIDVDVHEVWSAGLEDCDHDFGLEGVSLQYKTVDDEVLDGDAMHRSPKPGTYFYQAQCSRCDARHAYPEQA